MWELLWWHWAVLGGGLLVLDVLVLNIYYPLWFGIAAVCTALALALFPDMPLWAQIFLFAALAAAFLLLWLLLLRPQYSAKNRADAIRELPGQAGVVVHYNAQQKTGTLRLQKPVGGKDVWDFSAD